jgi:Domain of unknown function (DUF222)
VAAPASTKQALEMVFDGLDYLAAADPASFATEAQAECLLALEETGAVVTAVRARILGSYIACRGYAADGDYSPRSWLIHRTRITKGTAAQHLAWARRAEAHPRIMVALAQRAVSESYARKICEWSDKLPAECRDTADGILIAAARAGADLVDLVQLAAEMYTRSLPEDGQDQPEDTFEDRAVRVETTFGGAGVLTGDLTPECAAVITTVLESLAAPAGADDTRTKEQRCHDGLQEAMRRLIAAGLLPERAGQPVKVWAHVTLAGLLALAGGSALAGQWITGMAARWAAHRAAASEGGSDGGAWLAGPSLPLDIGFSTTIPAGIRNAVILRDRHCRWPGGCHQPAAACQVHHVKHLAHGGPTSLAGCVLLCSYHHQVVIHRQGWTLTLNPDGTTTAWNPDRTKILHSHSPPARAG